MAERAKGVSMAVVKTLSEVGRDDVTIVGGKAAGLGELLRAGVRVPKGFVIAAGITQHDEGSEAEILGAFDSLGATEVAVRSSAVAEDAADASWAGQLETFLYVRREDLIDRIKTCWASVASSRARAYAAQHGGSGGVAVVVQQMIASEVSGIAFSVNPVTGAKDEMVIEAGLGLGEAVVSGQITPDTYVVHRTPLAIADKDISTQTKQLNAAPNGGTTWQDVAEDRQCKQKLTDEEIKELARLVQKVERRFGFPVDVEWALQDNEIFLLQSRPITTL